MMIVGGERVELTFNFKRKKTQNFNLVIKFITKMKNSERFLLPTKPGITVIESQTIANFKSAEKNVHLKKKHVRKAPRLPKHSF